MSVDISMTTACKNTTILHISGVPCSVVPGPLGTSENGRKPDVEANSLFEAYSHFCRL